MKKYLPTSNTSKGFTLVELMVVVAIIGILAVVGLGVFNGAQGNARDGRRQAEIDSLAKSIESTRDPQLKTYKYDSTIFAKDYPNGLTDPGSTAYCQAGNNTTTDPVTPAYTSTTWTATACPVGYGVISGSTVGSVVGTNNDLTEGSITSWKVCAYLERSSKVFCKTSLIQ